MSQLQQPIFDSFSNMHRMKLIELMVFDRNDSWKSTWSDNFLQL